MWAQPRPFNLGGLNGGPETHPMWKMKGSDKVFILITHSFKILNVRSRRTPSIPVQSLWSLRKRCWFVEGRLFPAVTGRRKAFRGGCHLILSSRPESHNNGVAIEGPLTKDK